MSIEVKNQKISWKFLKRKKLDVFEGLKRFSSTEIITKRTLNLLHFSSRYTRPQREWAKKPVKYFLFKIVRGGKISFFFFHRRSVKYLFTQRARHAQTQRYACMRKIYKEKYVRLSFSAFKIQSNTSDVFWGSIFKFLCHMLKISAKISINITFSIDKCYRKISAGAFWCTIFHVGWKQGSDWYN